MKNHLGFIEFWHTCRNKIILTIQFRRWRRTHTMKDFDKELMAQGCTKVMTRHSTIYTTPNGVGKIEVTESEIIINGHL